MALDLELSLGKRWAISDLWSGRFRALQTKHRGLKIAYRRGYYLDDSRHAVSLAAKNAATVLRIETRLAKASLTRVDRRDREDQPLLGREPPALHLIEIATVRL